MDSQKQKKPKEEPKDPKKEGMAPDSASEMKKHETTPTEAAESADVNEVPDPDVP